MCTIINAFTMDNMVRWFHSKLMDISPIMQSQTLISLQSPHHFPSDSLSGILAHINIHELLDATPYHIYWKLHTSRPIQTVFWHKYLLKFIQIPTPPLPLSIPILVITLTISPCSSHSSSYLPLFILSHYFPSPHLLFLSFILPSWWKPCTS